MPLLSFDDKMDRIILGRVVMRISEIHEEYLLGPYYVHSWKGLSGSQPCSLILLSVFMTALNGS